MKSGARVAALAAAVLSLSAASDNAGTIQVDRSTYVRGSSSLPASTWGSDGPWQGVYVVMNSLHGQLFIPMWPSGTGVTEFPADTGSGSYDPSDSYTATPTLMQGPEEDDDWLNGWFRNVSTSGEYYFDNIGVPVKGVDTTQTVTGNGTLLAATWRIVTENGTQWDDEIGIIGLGNTRQDLFEHPSLLEQFKAAGRIASRAFGLHMGSAVLNQGGSLVLGGYEQNRVLGTVGVYNTVQSVSRYPGLSLTVYLVDVILGTETGGWPFKDLPEGATSVYRGLGNNTQAVQIDGVAGARAGSALAVLNPASPYIYLPPGTCEEAAKHLPVFWDPGTGLYLWNVSDPTYDRIVPSPAYLGFVLSDETVTNVTIKVPFPLLNLTLTPPVFNAPVPYFPCKPWNSAQGVWQLGRAFLQAAFLGVSYDHNLTFVAQAPGPGMNQSMVKTLQPGDTTIMASDGGTFEQTWRAYWTPIPEAPAATTMVGEPSAPDTDIGPGPSPGWLPAAIAVPISVAILAAAGAAFYMIRRMRKMQKRRRQNVEENNETAPAEVKCSDDQGQEARLEEALGPGELEGSATNITNNGRYELDGSSLLSPIIHGDAITEVESPPAQYEAQKLMGGEIQGTGASDES